LEIQAETVVLAVSYKTETRPTLTMVNDKQSLSEKLSTLTLADNVESITIFHPKTTITRETSLIKTARS